MSTFIQQLNPVHFWDLDFAGLDPELSKRIIVERIFALGNLDELRLVTGYYGKDAIIGILCGLNHMDPKTLNFCSVIFGVPKKKFKCYNRSRLIPKHWI
jgi:hypothetical protein